jgi:hypothetical protein
MRREFKVWRVAVGVAGGLRRREFKLRRAAVGVAIGLPLAVVISAVLPGLRPHRVTQENFDRIRKGMTPAEVQAILGPPDDYTTGPVKQPPPPQTGFAEGEWSYKDGAERPTSDTWRSDAASIWVVYDGSGALVYRSYIPMERIPQSAVDNLLWRARRQWPKWFPGP